MPCERLKEYLDYSGVDYELIPHAPSYTAHETAAVAHIRGRTLAKSVIVKIDGALAMVVVPATERVDLDLLRHFTGADRIELVPETEFSARFPDCEVGAMPPFGRLYGLQVFVSGSLGDVEEIAFNAGTHRELVQMSYADYLSLARPRVLRVAAAH
jgi:Ala-tRNA(Pro) deacylase